jgi:hypothetical protein
MLKKKKLEELGRIEGARGSIAVAQRAGGYVDYLVYQQPASTFVGKTMVLAARNFTFARDRSKHDEHARCVALESNRAHC